MFTKIVAILLLLGYTTMAHSQYFTKAELFVISPGQVLPENYTTINLGAEVITDETANLFQSNNPETRLQVISDISGNRYHILLQTNFSGKITYLAISNNLEQAFNKREKPMFLFNQCIKQLNSYNSPQQNIEAAIQCVMKRLEYCSD